MISPAQRTLIDFLNARLDAQRLAPEGPASWDEIEQTAENEGLAPIFLQRVKASLAGSLVPPPVLARLQERVVEIAAENLLLASELAKILRACASAYLLCVPIRGLALVEQLRLEAACRPANDLDLLVRHENLGRIADILETLGYREIDRLPGFARTYSYTLEFEKTGHGRVSVEPHWTIAYPPYIGSFNMNGVWSRLVPGRLLGIETYFLSPTDLLLHLCFHLIHKSEEAPLLWSYEIDRLIRLEGTSLDWPLFVRMTQESGQSQLVADRLDFIRRAFASPIADEVFQALAVPSPSAFRHGALFSRTSQLRLAQLLGPHAGIDGKESLAHLLTIPGIGAKLRYARGILFPSTAFMRAHYGPATPSQVALRYLARLLFFCREGLRGLFRLLAPSGSPPSLRP